MRLDFKSFLAEAEEPKGKALKHLTHIEDYPVHHGHEGVRIADEHLRSLHDMLTGKKARVHASVKYDGAPSIVFGTHPQTGQFFVASKSAFNKTPKINYTPEDIEANHGRSPGLVTKLKAALQYLPGIMPREGGVYQGDLMHTEGDATKKGGMTHITPNTLTYSAPSNSVEGRNMQKKLGVVIHTHYTGRGGLENLNAGPLSAKQRAKFNEHPDVNNIDPTLKVDPSNYTPEEQQAFHNHMEKAKAVYSSMKPESMDATTPHAIHIEGHVNHMIRTGGSPTVDGLLQHINDKATKEVEKVKTPAAKERKLAAHAETLGRINANREHFDKLLKLHDHLQTAKNVLVHVMAKNNPYQHSVMGEPTKPEGTVVVDKAGNASKANDRKEFNRLNFLKGAFQKSQQPEVTGNE